jgi:hypothetical protein
MIHYMYIPHEVELQKTDKTLRATTENWQGGEGSFQELMAIKVDLEAEQEGGLQAKSLLYQGNSMSKAQR